MWVKEILIFVKEPGVESKKIHTVFDSTKIKNLEIFIRKILKLAKVENPDVEWRLQTMKAAKTMNNKLDVSRAQEETFVLFPMTFPEVVNGRLVHIQSSENPHAPVDMKLGGSINSTPKLPRLKGQGKLQLQRANSEPSIAGGKPSSRRSDPLSESTSGLNGIPKPETDRSVRERHKNRTKAFREGMENPVKAKPGSTDSSGNIFIPGWALGNGKKPPLKQSGANSLPSVDNTKRRPRKKRGGSPNLDNMSDVENDSGVHSNSNEHEDPRDQDDWSQDDNDNDDSLHHEARGVGRVNMINKKKPDFNRRLKPPMSPGQDKEQLNEGIVRESKWIMPIEDRRAIDRKYKFEEVVGDGNFATVYKCLSFANKRYWAIKEIDKQKVVGKEHYIENEVDILCRCRHPNIIRLSEAYSSPTHYYMILELLEYGDLFDAIKSHERLHEPLAAGVVRDSALALHYLHQYDVVHRDIKPENLLLTADFRVKLADFGLACKVIGPLYRVCGTPTYVAPEILGETGYGVEVDLWSMGIIAYIMLVGYAPFRNKNREVLFELIQEGNYTYQSPGWNSVSRGAKTLVANLLKVNPSNRLTAAEIIRDKWIRQKTIPDYDEYD